MEYPGTKFTRPIRLAMLSIFIMAFFIIAPIIILYTAGYRYDWQNGLLKETGSINIDIEPKTAEIYLNGVRLQQKIPVRLNNIAPAKYNLRITSPGYFDWVKEIEVKNKQTNYIKEISLLQKNKPQNLINANINNFAISYDGQFILYTIQKNNNTEIWLRDNNSKTNTFISRININKAPDLIWAEKNNYALIVEQSFSAKTQDYKISRLTVFNPANPSAQTDLAQNNFSINKFQWGNSADPQLYFGTKENIFLYSPLTDKTQSVGKNQYLDWYVDNGQLWTLQTETSSQQYQVIQDTLGFSSVFSHLNANDFNNGDANATMIHPVQILAARQTNLLLKTNNNSQVALVTKNNVYNIPAEKFIISKYNNWWLLWSQWELWTYSQNEEPNLLNRSGEKLQQTIPLDEHNTLGLVWADKVTALFPYYSVTHELYNGKIIKAEADSKNKILYFISGDNNKEGIWKLNY